MTALRSLLFNAFFFIFTALFCLVMVPVLLLPPAYMRSTVAWWTRVVHRGLKIFAGIDHKITGLENWPEGGAIIACKHQSAWDTLLFVLLEQDVVYVLKQELARIPLYGTLSIHCGHIVVDRDGGASSLKKLVGDVKDRIAEGRKVVIFPEGTRTQPGVRGEYQPGIAALYSQIDAPVIPVATNSGMFWGRVSFTKRPGTILLDILPPLAKGLRRREFMAELEEKIEAGTRALEAQAPYALELSDASVKTTPSQD